jgi:hypothetical protein
MEALDLDRLWKGDRRAIARAISHIENETRAAADILRSVFVARAVPTGSDYRPGRRKSTLTNKLASHFRTQGKKVASSPWTHEPFSGGRCSATVSDDGCRPRPDVYPEHGIGVSGITDGRRGGGCPGRRRKD